MAFTIQNQHTAATPCSGRRLRAAMVVVAGLIVAPTGVALADHHGPPVGPDCVGTTFSTAARALPPGELGAVVRGFAQEDGNRPGLGDGIQALQNGDVPDEVAENTCND